MEESWRQAKLAWLKKLLAQVASRLSPFNISCRFNVLYTSVEINFELQQTKSELFYTYFVANKFKKYALKVVWLKVMLPLEVFSRGKTSVLLMAIS